MIKGQDIICFSTPDWDRPWGSSKQQIMLRLSANNRVLYVEYQTSFLHLFSLRILFSRIKNRFKEINRNLFIYTPSPYLPFGYYFRKINKINQSILLFCIRRALTKLNFNNLILWIYTPSTVDLLGRLNERIALYHCIADFANEKASRLRNKTMLSMEKELTQRTDIVLTLTEALFKRYKDINSSTYFFPSAGDETIFSSYLHKKLSEPQDIAGLKGPRIGLVGYLDGRLDVGLLCYLADEHPEWSIVLIGPRISYIHNYSSLTRRNNICFLNEEKNGEIPCIH